MTCVGLVAAELGQQLELHVGADRDVAAAVGDGDAVERHDRAVVAGDLAEADLPVERRHRAAHRQATILLIGNSKMSEAPASFSAGISVLIVRLSTTVSTANPPLASSLIVGDLRRRQHRRARP